MSVILKRVTSVLLALVIMIAFMPALGMTASNAYAATEVTPEGHGNSYEAYQLKGLGVGEYVFAFTSGNSLYLEVNTSVPAEVSIKEAPSAGTKTTGPNNGYLAQFKGIPVNASTVTVVVTEHKHNWSSETGICTICNEKCAHENTTVTGYASDGSTEDIEHIVSNTCDVCGYVVETKEAHEYVINGKGSNGYHEIKCSKCNSTKNVECEFSKLVKYKKLTDFDTKSYKHVGVYQCDCGATIDKEQGHKWKKDKCTKCGFKRINPGKVIGVKATKNKAPKKASVHWKGHWGNNKEWIPAHDTVFYKSTYTFTWKKAKNAYKYEVEYSPFVSSVVSGGKTVQTVSKNKVKLTMCLAKKSTTVTFKVTPISKTGTKGKTTTYKVKVK